eukprot:3870557-Rhodomonas_salina.1
MTFQYSEWRCQWSSGVFQVWEDECGMPRVAQQPLRLRVCGTDEGMLLPADTATGLNTATCLNTAISLSVCMAREPPCLFQVHNLAAVAMNQPQSVVRVGMVPAVPPVLLAHCLEETDWTSTVTVLQALSPRLRTAEAPLRVKHAPTAAAR